MQSDFVYQGTPVASAPPTATVMGVAAVGISVTPPSQQQQQQQRKDILYSSAELRAHDANLLPKELRPTEAGGRGTRFGPSNGVGGSSSATTNVCPPHRVALGICEEAVYLFVAAIYSNDVLAQLAATDAYNANTSSSANNNNIGTFPPPPTGSIADAPPAIIAFKVNPVGEIEVVTTAPPSSSTTTAVPSSAADGAQLQRPLYFDNFLEARAFRPFSFFTLYPTLLGALLLDKLYLLVPDEVELAAELPIEPGTQYYAASTAPTKSRGGHAKATVSRIYNIVSSTWVGVPFRSPTSPIPIPDMPKNEKGRLQLFNTGGESTRYVPMQNGATASLVSSSSLSAPSAVAGALSVVADVGGVRPASPAPFPPVAVSKASDTDDFFSVASPSTKSQPSAQTPPLPPPNQQANPSTASNVSNLSFFDTTARPPPSLSPSNSSQQQPQQGQPRRPNGPTFFVSFSMSDIVAKKTFYFCDDVDVAGDVPFPFSKPVSGISLEELTDLAVADAGAKAAMESSSLQSTASSTAATGDGSPAWLAAKKKSSFEIENDANTASKNTTNPTASNNNKAPLFDADWNQALRKPFRLGLMRALEPTIVKVATTPASSSSSSLPSAMNISSCAISVRGFVTLLAAAQYCSKLVRGFVSSQSFAVNKVPTQIQLFDTSAPTAPSHATSNDHPLSTTAAGASSRKGSDAADHDDDQFYSHLEMARSYNGSQLVQPERGDGGDGASSDRYTLSELKHVPAESMGLCVLDRQNNGNPGPRYYGRGLNDSASAAGNDHIVEVLMWQRVDVFASAVVPKRRSMSTVVSAVGSGAPSFQPPPAAPPAADDDIDSIFRQPSVTFRPPPPVPLTSSSPTPPPKSNADLLDDFFGEPSANPAAGTPTPSLPHQEEQRRPATPPPEASAPPTTAAAAAEPITEVLAGSYYRYGKYTILRGTIPVRWTTTLPNPLSLSSLGHFEAKMNFDTSPSATTSKHGDHATSSKGCGGGGATTSPCVAAAGATAATTANAANSQSSSTHRRKAHAKVTDLTSDYFATLWAKLGGGEELLEHLAANADPQYASKIIKVATSHGGNASVIGSDCLAFVPRLARKKPRHVEVRAAKLVATSQKPPPLTTAADGCVATTTTTFAAPSFATGSKFNAPRPRVRCVNLLRQKPENGEEDTLTQHFVDGVKRVNEVLFGAVFPPPAPQQHQQAVGIANSPPNALLELVHVDWLRLCKEFGTSSAVSVLWANTIPFLCGGGGAEGGAARQRRGSPFYATDDDGCATTGLIIPSRLNHGAARGVLSALVLQSLNAPAASTNASKTAQQPSSSSLIRLPLKACESDALLGLCAPVSPTNVRSVPSLGDYGGDGGAEQLMESPSCAVFSTAYRLGNYSQSPSRFAVTHIQSQFLRINCADSLDRTNLTSYMVGQQMTLELVRRIASFKVFPAATPVTATSGLPLSSVIAPLVPPSVAVFGSDSDSDSEGDDDDKKEKKGSNDKESKDSRGSRSVWKMLSNTVSGGKSSDKAIAAKKQQIQQLKAIAKATAAAAASAQNHYGTVTPIASNAPAYPITVAGNDYATPPRSNTPASFVNPDSFESLSTARMIDTPRDSVAMALMATAHMSPTTNSNNSDAVTVPAGAVAQSDLYNLRMVASQVIGHRDNIISLRSALVISACDPIAAMVREEIAKDEGATLGPRGSISGNVGGGNQYMDPMATSINRTSRLRPFRAPFASGFEDMIEDGVRQVKNLRSIAQQQYTSQSRAASQFVDVSGDAVVGFGTGGAAVVGSTPTNGGSNDFISIPLPAPSPIPPSITVPYGLLRALSVIYVACGDAISMSYTNTDALHTNLLRGFSGSKPTSSNAVLSTKRLYENTFQDKKKMRLIDALLGRNLELHFPLLCSGPYYVCKLPFNQWRNAVVLHGLPSWATEADVDAAVRKAWDTFLRGRSAQNNAALPVGKNLKFQVKTAMRYHHYTPSLRSISALTAFFEAKNSASQAAQQQVTANPASLVHALMSSITPHSVPATTTVTTTVASGTTTKTAFSNPMMSASAASSQSVALLQNLMGSKIDLGAPRTRARGQSMFSAGVEGGAQLPRKATATAAMAPSAASKKAEEDDFFGTFKTSQPTPANNNNNADDGDDEFVMVDDAHESVLSGSEDEEEEEEVEEEAKALDALREATSSVKFDKNKLTSALASAASSATSAAAKVAGGGGAGGADEDDGYTMSMQQLEGLVEGAKHMAVIVFEDDGHIQYANPLLSMGAIEVLRWCGKLPSTNASNNSAKALVDSNTHLIDSSVLLNSSALTRRPASSYKAICQVRPYDYGHEGRGQLSLNITFEQYHSLYPVACSDPTHYASEKVVKYAPPTAAAVAAAAGGGGAATPAQAPFLQPQYGGNPMALGTSPSFPSTSSVVGGTRTPTMVVSNSTPTPTPTNASMASANGGIVTGGSATPTIAATATAAAAALAPATVTVPALFIVGNEYPCDASKRHYYSNEGDDDGSGVRDAGGGGGGSSLSAATSKAVSTFKSGLRSLVRNF